jgi:PAS domain-containing protein
VRERTAELRESEARYRSLTELASDWYWEQDETGRLHQGLGPGAGDAGHAGRPAGRRRGRDDDAVWDAAERQALQDHIAARRPFLDFVFHQRDGLGLVRQFRVSGQPMFDQSCRFLGYRGIGVEMHARP